MIDYYKINEEIVSKIGDINQKIPENTWKNSEFWEIPLVILILFFLFSITAMILSVSDAEFFYAALFGTLSILTVFGLLFTVRCLNNNLIKKEAIETHKAFNEFKKEMSIVKDNIDEKELKLFRRRISKINKLCENSYFSEDMQLCPDNRADKYTVNVIMSAIYENKNIEKEYIKKASDYVR